MKSLAFTLIALAAAPAALAASNGVADDSLAASKRPVTAVRTGAPIVVDGLLDEPVWHNDHAATWFRQSDPVEGAEPSQRTEVRMAYDDEALYVGARMYDSAPDSIQARLSRRDFSIPADRFGLFLDPYCDRRTGYYFIVNAAGTQFDGTLMNDSWDDSSWDGVWESRARIDSLGWSLEMRIPYSQLRFQKSDRYQWGINFKRVIQRRSEEDYLVYQPKRGSGFVSRFPLVTGIENIHPGRAIEVLPYVTNKAEYLVHAPLDPFNDGSRLGLESGADLRMAVGSRLTLNATANPDFGQVEVDPAVVNLSNAETFFTEKRPFFVEGSSNFGCGNQGANDYWGFNWPEPNFFYSRRIGRAPQGGVSGDYVDEPIGTRILGAAKLTGKLTSSMNVGVLQAVTAREFADVSASGIRSRQEVEPQTYYGVLRGLKEFKDRRQGFGVMTTLAARSFEDHALEDQLNAQSLVTATDGWAFLDRNQTWVISGWSALTHVRGTASEIRSVQTNRLHYLQRPDADHLGVDPGATSLTGFGSRYWLNKQKGSWMCNSALGFMNPKFDVNDMGYMRRADVINGHIGGGYKWTKPTKLHKYQDVLGAVFASYNFDGDPTWGGVWGGGQTEFVNNYSWNYKLAFNPQTVNDRRTRGGPLMLNKPGYEIYDYFDTDGAHKLFYFFEYDSYHQTSGSWNLWANPGVEWKPVSNVLFRVGPELTLNHENAQFIGAFADPLAGATFGQRYVFATLDQTQVSAGVRLNWAFTPRLSFQLYAQPLISTGEYSDFKELARPRSYEFKQYLAAGGTYDKNTGTLDPDGPGPAPAFAIGNPDWGFDGHPDFDYKSLRGNAVMRWEYLPGSTLYLVWTQTRSDLLPHVGNFDLGPSLDQLTSTDADNIFLAKVTYYFSL
ncbi:MAG TPA: DUF5916 domain-containing protein [Candidatus Eisenbacteria bacterium]